MREGARIQDSSCIWFLPAQRWHSSRALRVVLLLSGRLAGLPSASGLLKMFQKSPFPGKQTFQPGEFGSSPSHTISLVKEIFGTYSSRCLLVVAVCLQNKQDQNMPHCSHTVGFIFLWHFRRWCRKWGSLQSESRSGQRGLCGWQ